MNMIEIREICNGCVSFDSRLYVTCRGNVVPRYAGFTCPCKDCIVKVTCVTPCRKYDLYRETYNNLTGTNSAFPYSTKSVMK